jgi:hypothetical protein
MICNSRVILPRLASGSEWPKWAEIIERAEDPVSKIVNNNHAFVRGVLEGGSAPVQRTPTTHLPLPTPATPVRADLRVYQALLQRAGA